MNMNKLKLSLLLTIICLKASAFDIYVSPAGSDKNLGTKDQPLATLSMALRNVRNMRRLNMPEIKDGVHIVLRGGIYILEESILIRPEDSGTESSPTIIEAASGERPVFSSGIQVTSWKKANVVTGLPKEAQNNIWVVDAPFVGGRPFEYRQLWVNNIKANRASDYDEGKILNRILSVNKLKEEMWIPKPSFGALKDGKQMEFFIHQWWAIAILRVKSVTVVGDSACVKFYQPESRIEFEHPWPAPFIDEMKNQNGNSAFFFMNDIRFLDSPGEWFHDQTTGKIYYWPRSGEDLSKAIVILPSLEKLIQIEGTVDNPISNIFFKGLNFEHTTWLRPSKEGHVPLQAGHSILDAYKLKVPGTPDKAGLENQAWLDRQTAAVTIKNANHLSFERCNFKHLAATGIDFIGGTNHNTVKGCLFSDIGGTAIQIGFFGDASFEAHLPYNPSDERTVCQFENISNNLITNASNEDWGCVGISVGYARDITIEHNEISNVNYSGICIGWGWTRTVNCLRNNKVNANHIHHFAKNMYDVGGIYTLSAQPNTEIRGNSIHHLEKAPYTHDPKHFQYIYFDENSSYIRAIDNWTEKDKFFSNNPGPGNEWTNNGPQVSDEIKNKAGLEEGYKDLLKDLEK
jgi:hypothetical protein